MQIFHRSTNTIAKVSIFGAVFFLGFFGWAAYTLMGDSGYVTGQYVVKHQPVPFSHEHHVRGLGIDCRYCHTSVERSAFAGLPPTETCMNCHRQIWTNAELLEPIRASYRDNVPVQWTRVHDLPDYVYFNHSVHIAKGIGCASCHGKVNQMPLMFQNASLQMQWCLDCHRNPVKNVRPREEVFNIDWNPSDPASYRKYMRPLPREASNARWEPSAGDVARLQAKLAKEYDLHSLTSCSTCHR
ncbi:MAG TPA: cytochrome c3 family protein [Thermoanaerobaculia bacterium]